jgi:hypothetical protein
MTEPGAKRAIMPAKSPDFESGVPLIVVTTSPASIPAAVSPVAGPRWCGISGRARLDGGQENAHPQASVVRLRTSCGHRERSFEAVAATRQH